MVKLETYNFSKIVLTQREQEVLHFICQGNTFNAVAKLLHLSPHTIVTHKKNLIKKFDAKNIVHLGVLAERYGYLDK